MSPQKTKTPTERKPLLTAQEAAEYLGLEYSTLEKWRGQGRGPNYVKCGGSVRYRQNDLDTWIESRVVKTAAVA